MKENLQKVIEQFVDLLMPELTPYEVSLYIFLLRNSYLKSISPEIRIGKRTIGEKFSPSKGKSGKVDYGQVSVILKRLEQKGCIKIGDTNRDGTLYTVLLPQEVASVKEKLSIVTEPIEDNYFKDPEKRKEIFERDKYTCHYCGEKVTPDNATLDHLIPQHINGKHTKENLKTSCLLCNSIKSGKTYEEAAPLLLKSIQERREKNNNS